MQKSARILGLEYGLTGQEMNRLLAKQGFLEGEPSNYYPTEKAQPFVKESYQHMGPGWTLRTFDDSILDELVITNDIKADIRAEISAERAAKQAEKEAKWVAFKNSLLENEGQDNQMSIPTEEDVAQELETQKTDIALGILFIVVTAGFIIYKTVPRIKQWREKHKRKRLKESTYESEIEEGCNDALPD